MVWRFGEDEHPVDSLLTSQEEERRVGLVSETALEYIWEEEGARRQDRLLKEEVTWNEEEAGVDRQTE